MKLTKRILKSNLFLKLLNLLIVAYAKIIYLTCKWEVKGSDNVNGDQIKDKPFILVLWHNRILMAPFFPPRKREINAVISTHSDGEIVANFMHSLGVGLIRGSTSKGAISAAKHCIKTLKENKVLVITPDGPRGPRMRLGGNLINFAKMSGAPIVPFTYTTKKCKVLDTWDKFLLPLPFSKGVCEYGSPIYVDKNINDNDIDNIKKEVENSLNQISKNNDIWLDLEPILPAKLQEN